MAAATSAKSTANKVSAKTLTVWKLVQAIVWLIGAGIFFALLFVPRLGLLVLWNILIPVAPALVVVACGVWRNICPLATTTLFARRFGLSKKKKMPAGLQAKLQLTAIIALYLIVPLRHLLFNTNGTASAVFLLAAAVTGISMGLVYDWKSAWCNSLCPVHPVEKLYGQNAVFMAPNAHCDKCANCSIPCPDSTPNIHPSASKKTTYNRISGLLTVGGLPGFIFGWFFVPDYSGPISAGHFFEVYRFPLAGLLISCLLYLILHQYIAKKNERILISYFAAAGVSCYYWFRIPALLGFGRFSSDVVLFNLKNTIPQWNVQAMVLCTTGFFFWWLVFRKPNHKSWLQRPAFVGRSKKLPAAS